MIDTDKCEHILYGTKFNPIDVYNVAEELLAEVKRLKAKLFEAELWVNNDSYTFENSIKELNDYLEVVE